MQLTVLSQGRRAVAGGFYKGVRILRLNISPALANQPPFPACLAPFSQWILHFAKIRKPRIVELSYHRKLLTRGD